MDSAVFRVDFVAKPIFPSLFFPNTNPPPPNPTPLPPPQHSSPRRIKKPLSDTLFLNVVLFYIQRISAANYKYCDALLLRVCSPSCEGNNSHLKNLGQTEAFNNLILELQEREPIFGESAQQVDAAEMLKNNLKD
ncbi:uncharacterized protein LOC132032085 [Lycium ferocissimum]|uniref:uncharacterized protein LOC132032085 n=1 Tax=Lycium ferocissimum TaxID=112874 RepID=UPI0028167C1A|nr:uncharacterized protein LOC132032085 [Lycium ferocissimum]